MRRFLFSSSKALPKRALAAQEIFLHSYWVKFIPFIPAVSLMLATLVSAESSPDPLTAPAATIGHYFSFGAETDAGQDLDWQRSRIKAPLGAPIKREDFTLMTFLGYEVFNFDDTALLAGHENLLHRLALPISFFYTPEGSKWGGFATVTPQLNTDFEHVDSNDFSIDGRIGGFYKWSDSLTLNFGVGSSRRLGDEDIIPTLGFDWTPNDDFNITARGGKLTASYRAHSDVILRGGASVGGGLWNVETPNGTSIDQGLSSVNLGLGVDYKLTQGVWLSLWAGATLANELKTFDTGGSKLNEIDLDEGWFLYAGVNVYEW